MYNFNFISQFRLSFRELRSLKIHFRTCNFVSHIYVLYFYYSSWTYTCVLQRMGSLGGIKIIKFTFSSVNFAVNSINFSSIIEKSKIYTTDLCSIYYYYLLYDIIILNILHKGTLYISLQVVKYTSYISMVQRNNMWH